MGKSGRRERPRETEREAERERERESCFKPLRANKIPEENVLPHS